MSSIDFARSMSGPVTPEVKARLQAAIDNPCEETWDNAYSIILNPDVGLGLTLWQAVIAVDPAFASVKGPVTRWMLDDNGEEHSEPVSGWARTPSAVIIEQAISYATN